MAEQAGPNSPHISWSDSFSQGQQAIKVLSQILPSFPSNIIGSEDPSQNLLHNAEISAQITQQLRQPDSGAGDNNLCRWLYDTFQFAKPNLQLVVLKFLPHIAGVYLSRVPLRKPLAGFEAVLLAIYSHETAFRNGQAVTVNIPDLSHSSIYHEAKPSSAKNNVTELNLAVISPGLEPHGTVRSTRRARIVGVALELYYSKISEMPVDSKIAFCEFCVIWAGVDGEVYKETDQGIENKAETSKPEKVEEVKEKMEESEGKGEKREATTSGRIPLPWELLQPVLRILGHCLMGSNKNKELYEAACVACRSLYARSLHDINPKGMLATGSLLRLLKFNSKPVDKIDHTEISITNIISI
ncbi:Hyccin [Heracleum sosnowskyi]|uniref:Hyccin n=1 Tax=Heracleum sosnowskyi TaxID=360622 RepID=A0AAD8GV61_9APIA|nr:Hyccin [Heracleum sosnowskyi]